MSEEKIEAREKKAKSLQSGLLRTKPSLVKNEKKKRYGNAFNPMSTRQILVPCPVTRSMTPQVPKNLHVRKRRFFQCKKIPPDLESPCKGARSFIRFLHRNAVSHLRMRQIDPHSRDLGCSPHEHLTAISHQESVFAPRDEESSTLLGVGNFRSQPRPR